MIRFACPSCNRAYSVSPRAAGKKTTCQSCGQRILIPEDTPLPGIPLPSNIGTFVAGPTASAPQQSVAPDDDIDIDVRAGSGSPATLGLLAVGIVILLAAVVGVLVVIQAWATEGGAPLSGEALGGSACYLFAAGLASLLWLVALIDCLANEPQGGDKAVWLAVILLLPGIGPILYLAIRRSQRS